MCQDLLSVGAYNRKVAMMQWTESLVKGWRLITPPWTNLVLDSVGWIAITRGVLYGFGAQPRDIVPRGLDLLPAWMLYIYGLFWLLAGVTAVVAARGQNGKRQLIAQRMLGALCMVWSSCFLMGVFFPADLSELGVPPQYARVAAFISAWFFLLLARISWNAKSLPSILATEHERGVTA